MFPCFFRLCHITRLTLVRLGFLKLAFSYFKRYSCNISIILKMLTSSVICWSYWFACNKEMSINPKWKFSRKCLMIILKVTKKQDFNLSLENTVFEKKYRGGSNWPPAFLGLRTPPTPTLPAHFKHFCTTQPHIFQCLQRRDVIYTANLD